MATRDTNDLDVGAMLRGAVAEQKLFGRYTLRKILGRGGMGVVWLARDDELERNVAMKFLPDMIVRDREAVEDLKRETRRSLDLTHHHIVRIYDFTQDDQCAAIIMEYVDGESLSAMKTQQGGGCFSVSTAQSWISHFCQAMDYAHRQARVVHRDLKPANLMVNGRGDLKVTDFGISRSMSDSMTRVSMSNSAGTLAYMSPEQALGSPPAVGDDIYAFGATVYDMLTGRPPFFRGNLQVQLETVIPPPMESRRAELGNSGEPVPALWEEVIAACLSKRPQDRPQGMAEIASLLGIGGSTTAGFRPSTGRGLGGAGGPGTSATAPATHRTASATEGTTPKTSTAPGVPATVQPTPASHALRPTRREDILFDYPSRVSTPEPAPTPTSRTEPVSPPAERPVPVAPAPEPEPAAVEVSEASAVVEALVAPVEAPVPPVEAPIISEEMPAPPVEDLLPADVPAPAAVEEHPVEDLTEIPQRPATAGPPVEKEIAATLILPAIQPPTERIVRAPAPAPTAPVLTPAPEPSFSSQTKIGHAIGSGATRKSSYTGLIAAGVGVIFLVALLGLWVGHREPSSVSDSHRVELASHLAAANTALAAGDLAVATREVAAVKSLDPANAQLAALQSALQRLTAATDKAVKEKNALEQQTRDRTEKERLAKIEQEKERLAKLEQVEQEKARAAEVARQQLQQQFDAALAATDAAIGQRDPATARQSLAAAQEIRPNDDQVSKLTARIAALEDELKPKTADATPDALDKPAGVDEPDKSGHKPPAKEPVAKAKPKAKHEPEPESSRPVAQRPPPPASRPAATTSVPPKRPSNPFNGGAPGG